ncbi:hypothetical protein EYC84_005101 [Monilinia fructicola]|uniref:Major facilitator superfamily (MFS) profile domain-containing protein n=1 Tax=Monilinia fructicola TaxID=38448 RepID=A0A5M9K064_MONFR|nr:hypothetical protein EYC84_005101 [Monilinia fructicola]
MAKSEDDSATPQTQIHDLSPNTTSRSLPDIGVSKEVRADAHIATEIEHSMTFRDGLRLYPAAVGWSAFFSLGIIMTAFDPQLLGSLYATPAFQRDFGYKYKDGYIISAPWQTALGMGNPIGQVVGALAVGYPMEWYGRKWLDDHWAYSAPFAIQWLWPVIIMAAMMIETDRLELEMETGTTYWDVFNKANIRRTEIAIAVFVTQVFSGIYLVGYAAYFFQLAGLAGSKAFDMSVGFLAVGFLGSVLSWILIAKYGRRRIYNTGIAVLTALMFLIGILDCAPNYENRPAVIWAQSTLMIVWNGIFDLTIGPVCYTIFCEVSATKVRSKTIAVATAMQALVGIVMTVAIPYMINPDQANWRGKIGFFYGGCSIVCFIWCWLRVPETKGRTYEELDLMFARGVKTRDFKHYKIVIGEWASGHDGQIDIILVISSSSFSITCSDAQYRYPKKFQVFRLKSE